MASVFSRIISGELPARFVWKDDRAVAFLSINPLKPGHTLLVPREEIDHWLDLPPSLAAHLMDVGQKIGRGIQRAYTPLKVGMLIAGLEVPHVHVHLVAIDDVLDLDFDRQEADPDPARMDADAAKIRAALRELRYDGVSE